MQNVAIVTTAQPMTVAEYIAFDARFPVPALGVELAFEDVYEGVRLG